MFASFAYFLVILDTLKYVNLGHIKIFFSKAKQKLEKKILGILF